MNREERFIKFYNAVHAEIEGYFSKLDLWNKIVHREDDGLAFSLDPSGQVHITGYRLSDGGAVITRGAADVVVCAGSVAYFANPIEIDSENWGGKNPIPLSYPWEQNLCDNLAHLLQFIEDEPSSNVDWPQNAAYWRQRAHDGTVHEKSTSWLRKLAAVTGKAIPGVRIEQVNKDCSKRRKKRSLPQTGIRRTGLRS